VSTKSATSIAQPTTRETLRAKIDVLDAAKAALDHAIEAERVASERLYAAKDRLTEIQRKHAHEASDNTSAMIDALRNGDELILLEAPAKRVEAEDAVRREIEMLRALREKLEFALSDRRKAMDWAKWSVEQAAQSVFAEEYDAAALITRMKATRDKLAGERAMLRALWRILPPSDNQRAVDIALASNMIGEDENCPDAAALKDAFAALTNDPAAVIRTSSDQGRRPGSVGLHDA